MMFVKEEPVVESEGGGRLEVGTGAEIDAHYLLLLLNLHFLH